MKRKVRAVSMVMALALTATLGMAGSASAVTPQERGETVRIRFFTFYPNALEVEPGTLIKVVNLDGRKRGIPHSLTADDGSFDTGVFTKGTRKFFAPSTPGSYDWFCVVHPNMEGVLRVG